jgi:hypothetical protein
MTLFSDVSILSVVVVTVASRAVLVWVAWCVKYNVVSLPNRYWFCGFVVLWLLSFVGWGACMVGGFSWWGSCGCVWFCGDGFLRFEIVQV